MRFLPAFESLTICIMQVICLKNTAVRIFHPLCLYNKCILGCFPLVCKYLRKKFHYYDGHNQNIKAMCVCAWSVRERHMFVRERMRVSALVLTPNGKRMCASMNRKDGRVSMACVCVSVRDMRVCARMHS